MSGQEIGTVIGAAVAMAVPGLGIAYVGMGMSIGGVVGNFLMPDTIGLQDQAGPRLSDLKVTIATYGTPINKVYGTYRIGGNIIWSLPIVETKHVEEQEVGKGGSETYDVITYSYDVSFAVALCEGPVTGIKRIWADSVLIYDGNSTTAFYSSGEYTSGPLDIFLGESDQVIDWSMQSYNADTPAYRNICYIRFNNLQLEKFGNRMPNITAEVVVGGEQGVTSFLEDEDINFRAPDAYVQNEQYTPALRRLYDFRVDARELGLYQTHFDGYKTYLSTHYGGTGLGSGYSNIFVKYTNNPVANLIVNEQIAFENEVISGYGTLTPYFAQTAIPYHKNIDGGMFSTGWGWWGGSFLTFHSDPTSLIKFHRIINLKYIVGDHGRLLAPFSYVPSTESHEQVFYKDNFYCLANALDYGLGAVYKGKGLKEYPWIDEDIYSDYNKWNLGSYQKYGVPTEGGLHTIIGASTFPVGGDRPLGFDVNYDKIYILTSNSSSAPYPIYIKVYDLNGALEKTTDITNLLFLHNKVPTSLNLRIFVQDSYIHIIVYVYEGGFASHSYLKLTLDCEKVVSVPFKDGGQTLIQDFSRMPMMYHSGLIKCVFRNGSTNTGFYINDWTINLNYISASITLKTITDDLCKRSGLLPTDYNNFEGASVEIDGFAITQTASARSSISLLQSVYLFDFPEDGFDIGIKLRDGIQVNSILESEIVDETFNTTRALETDLPRSIKLNYSNPDIDYQIGSQTVSRVDSNSDNQTSFDLAINMDDTEAKQLAEKMLFSTWTGRTALSFRIPFRDDIFISDVVSVDYDNMIYYVRISKMIINNIYIDIEAISESDTMYISNAIGSDTTRGTEPNLLSIPAESIALIFNAPSLDNSILNSFSIYFTAYGSSNSWKGSNIFKSKTNGDSYYSIGAVFPNNSSAIGKSDSRNLLPSASTRWDLSSVSVKLSYGTLSSSTNENVLSGSNYIMIGNEVLQYVNATYNATDDSYVLDTLLRGRRGTEWAIDSHDGFEDFIFLNSEIFGSPSTLNVERDYKAVSFGTLLNNSFNVKETYNGANLMPFTPSNLEVNGNVITWTRRDRYISGYMRALQNTEIIEKYKVELFYLDVSQIIIYIVDLTQYTYDDIVYPDVDKIQVSQYSENLLDYGYVSEVLI